MINQSSPPKKIEQIIQNILQLLSFEEKDTNKIQQLLAIFDESISLNKQLKISQIQNQTEDQQILEQTLKVTKLQKQKFIQAQIKVIDDVENFRLVKEKVLETFLKSLGSIYLMKQLQSLMRTNYRKQKINQKLKQANDQLTKQYQLHEQQISQSYYQNRNEQETIINIKKQLENQLKFKKAQSIKMERQIQRSTIRQQQQRKDYKQSLQKQNKDRIEKVKLTKYSESYNLRERSSTHQSQEKSVIIPSIPTNIEIKAKHLKYENKIEMSIGITLTILTLILAVYWLMIHQ